MRCKPGGLAVQIRITRIENVGRLVEVVRYFGLAKFKNGDKHSDCWLVRHVGRPFATFSGAPRCEYSASLGADGCTPDAWLRPIRGTDGTDETLDWAGLPAAPEQPVIAGREVGA